MMILGILYIMIGVILVALVIDRLDEMAYEPDFTKGQIAFVKSLSITLMVFVWPILFMIAEVKETNN